jgi:addiction module RelB/DinJ family antitoxin
MQTHTHSKPKTSLYQFRIDEQEKAKAFAVIESMGLKPAQALRLFLHRVSSTNALPFPIETRPNHESN